MYMNVFVASLCFFDYVLSVVYGYLSCTRSLSFPHYIVESNIPSTNDDAIVPVDTQNGETRERHHDGKAVYTFQKDIIHFCFLIF